MYGAVFRDSRKSPFFAFPCQEMLEKLYADLDREEEELQKSPSQLPPFKRLFKVLYGSGTDSGPVRLVGPVGERPALICFLRAGILDGEARDGLLDAIRQAV